jgi:hypothetical protein
MGVTYTVDGSTISSVDLASVELVESADAGQVGSGKLTIDDAAGTLATVGFKDVAVSESDCSAPLLQSGFVGTRTIRRGTYRTGAKRKIDLNILDLNDLLNRRVIRKHDGKRPAEKMSVRLHWLLGSEYLSGLVADNGFVDYPTIALDKNDYTNSRPGDVLGDMAVQGEGRQFFVYADPDTDEPSLWFRDSATSTDFSSTLRISNDLSDVDSLTTFAASQSEMSLERDPDQVFSRAAVPYARGTVYEVKTSTASTFVERDGVAPTSSIKTAAKASKIARRFLNDHDHETDTVNDSIIVPSSRSGLIHAGMRISAKYTHTAPEGYSDFTWYRILERRLSHIVSPGGIPEAPGEPLYKIALRMVPQEGDAPASCPYELTATGDYYPLGFFQFDGWNWAANPSDGFTYYERGGYLFPVTPLPGFIGNVHFPMSAGGLGAPGGAGAIDYAGDCAFGNTFQWMPVGPGVLTVQTEIFDGSPRPVAFSWGESPDAYTNSVGTFTTGDEVEITVTGECVNLVRMYDGPGSPCGGKWGYSLAHWEAA